MRSSSSPSNERDRNERFFIFQKLDSLKQYVLVSQEERRIEGPLASETIGFSETHGAGETIPHPDHETPSTPFTLRTHGKKVHVARCFRMESGRLSMRLR